ncbi:MAG: 2-C-methyl-D-erythritol 4-phosphate cytidylyltransferase [Flavipsychrobacter sp.]
MKKYAVIVAGGKGLRMDNAVPKQFLPLLGKPILYHTIKAFKDAYEDIDIILVLPQDQTSYTQMVLQSFTERIELTIVPGGATRYHSVQNGLNMVKEESIVFVHDGVRPLVTKELIQRCFDDAIAYGSAIPAVPVSDSMRLVDGGHSKPVDRSMMRAIQTPQTFKSEILLPAFRQDYQDAFTDEATVVEHLGTSVHITEGEKSNLKITTPIDMKVAEAILESRLEDA